MELIFSAHCDQEFNWDPDRPLVVACSGGLDSVVLVHLMHTYRGNLILAHMNYGLRGQDSDKDQALVTALGADLKENTQLQPDEEISEVGACKWLLKLENDTSVLFDPVNLSEEFQQGNLEVWVLFTGMRRMNRCPEANPIWIQDMVLRQG